MHRQLPWIALLLLLGCERAATSRSQDCAAQAAALETWLTALFDDTAVLAPPWPANPTEKAAVIAEGVEPGKLDKELATCPPARDQLVKAGQVAPGERRAAMIGLADAIAACDCKVNLSRVKTFLYIGQRGPN